MDKQEFYNNFCKKHYITSQKKEWKEVTLPFIPGDAMKEWNKQSPRQPFKILKDDAIENTDE